MTSVEDSSMVPDGYPKLSSFLGEYPKTAIFRKFAVLNSQNILYMQAELSHLEVELKEITKENSRSVDPQKHMYSRDWWTLNRASKECSAHTQMAKILEIREKLLVYNAAVLQQSELNKLSKPRPHYLQVLRRWLQSPEYGNFSLIGLEAQVWDDENMKDLITIDEPRPDEAAFSGWFADWFINIFHQYVGYRFKGPVPTDVKSGLTNYEKNTPVSVLSVAILSLSAMLPTVSLFILYYVKNNVARLGVITAFSGLLSAALAIFTKARKIEIFGAIAALAAVQVVFIGNSIS